MLIGSQIESTSRRGQTGMGISSFTKLGKLGSVKSLRGSPPPVAIDFGVHALKAIQLSGTENPSLIAVAQLDTPEGLLEDPAGRLRFQIETLPKLIRSGGFNSQRAVFSIPAAQMFCKHLQVQRIEGVKLGDMVSATLAQQMECDPKALLVRHAAVRDVSPGKTEIVCFASARRLVEQLMGAVKAAKLNPVGVHTEIHAVLESTPSNVKDDDAPVLAHIDLGHGTTKVVIARGKQILFARVVPFGGIRLDQAVARQTQLSIEKAHERRVALTSYSKAPANQPVPATAGESFSATGTKYVAQTETTFDLSEPLEIFADELRMCMRYHRSLSPTEAIERIVFTGGESKHEALCAHLAESLRMPAQVADPMARIGRSGKEPVSGLTLSESQPGWSVAVGLALSPTDL
ncbi:MAG: type IV pilus assembly protein PilM [Phycisphaerales bacterium]|jgi:type IV pilus assembly protein PilM